MRDIGGASDLSGMNKNHFMAAVNVSRKMGCITRSETWKEVELCEGAVRCARVLLYGVLR